MKCTSEQFNEKRVINMAKRENVDSIINVFDSIINLYANNDMNTFPSSFEAIDHYLDSLENNGLDSYLFFNQLITSNISKELLLTKLVAASINGAWKADTINSMQDAIRQLAISYPGLLSNILSNYTTEMRYSFWLFFFDTIHPSNYQDLCDTLLMNQNLNAEHILIRKAFDHNISKEHSQKH